MKALYFLHRSIAQVILESFAQVQASMQNGITPEKPELLLFSANTETSLKAQIRQYQRYIQLNSTATPDIAYTRAVRREQLPHKAFAIVENGDFIETSGGLKTSQNAPDITMVFSGQGAQWPEMGKELILADHDFREDIFKMNTIIKSLRFHAPEWNLTGIPPAILNTMY
jgi:acyl transferase domain-containing protein